MRIAPTNVAATNVAQRNAAPPDAATKNVATKRVTTKMVAMKTVAILISLLALAFLAAAAPPAISSADPQRYLDDIKALTTPAMEGRGAGTKGITRAEHLIEKRYKTLGLEPAGTHSYSQPFTVITGAQLKGKNSLTFVTGAEKHEPGEHEPTRSELKVKQDFVPSVSRPRERRTRLLSLPDMGLRLTNFIMTTTRASMLTTKL